MPNVIGGLPLPLHTLTGSIMGIVQSWGYVGIFFWMAVGSACIPVPSEVILPFAGALTVTKGVFSFHAIAMVGALGNLFGSLVAYAAGYWGGRPFLERYGRYVLIRRHDIDSADRWFRRYGEATVFFCRMVPFIRAFVSLPAGTSRMSFWRFTVYTFFGGLVWSYFLTWLGVKLGQRWESLTRYFHRADLAIVVIVGVLAAVWIWRHLRPEAGQSHFEQDHPSAEPIKQILP